MNPDQDTHQTLIKMLKRIDGMQSKQKYKRISIWLQHIPIHNLLPLEKASCSGSSYTWKNTEDHIDSNIFQGRVRTRFSKTSLQMMKNAFFMTIFNAKGWISLAYSKGGASWKSYAVCIVGSPQYYSFWVFKPQLVNTDLYSQQLQCVQENLRKCSVLVNRRNVVLLYDNIRSHSTEIIQEKLLD